MVEFEQVAVPARVEGGVGAREVASSGLSSHALAKWVRTTKEDSMVALVPPYAEVDERAMPYHLCTAKLELRTRDAGM